MYLEVCGRGFEGCCVCVRPPGTPERWTVVGFRFREAHTWSYHGMAEPVLAPSILSEYGAVKANITSFDLCNTIIIIVSVMKMEVSDSTV
jgi:hypothetical protein